MTWHGVPPTIRSLINRWIFSRPAAPVGELAVIVYVALVPVALAGWMFTIAGPGRTGGAPGMTQLPIWVMPVQMLLISCACRKVPSTGPSAVVNVTGTVTLNVL